MAGTGNRDMEGDSAKTCMEILYGYLLLWKLISQQEGKIIILKTSKQANTKSFQESASRLIPI